MIQLPKKEVTTLQNCTDGGVPIESNYLVINEVCLTPVLESLGQKGLVDKKKLTCAICNQIVDEDSIRAIIPRHEEIDYLCTKAYCIDKYFHSKTNR